MPESSLALKKSDLESEVGLFLGYGRGSDAGDTAWTSAQSAAIASCVKSGLRQFYFNPAVPERGVPASYSWSFLQPTLTVTLASGADSIDLPADFSGLQGNDLTLSDSNRPVCRIPLVGEGEIRRQFAYDADATGQPLMAAVRPLKERRGERGQRFELLFWPAADQAYTVEFTYHLTGEALTGDAPYAYGGAAHAETILESCLAIAEQRLDDSMTVHSEKFKERLEASVAHDRRGKPQHLGYNADRSDAREWWGRRRGPGIPTVTWDGVEYD